MFGYFLQKEVGEKGRLQTSILGVFFLLEKNIMAVVSDFLDIDSGGEVGPY